MFLSEDTAQQREAGRSTFNGNGSRRRRGREQKVGVGEVKVGQRHLRGRRKFYLQAACVGQRPSALVLIR